MSAQNNRGWARGQVSEPHQPRRRDVAAVEYLRLVAFRYLRGNATAREMRDACAGVVAELDALANSVPNAAAPTPESRT